MSAAAVENRVLEKAQTPTLPGPRWVQSACQGDPEMLADILAELKRMEERYSGLENDLTYGPSRRVLVDWMVELSDYFGLPPTTYHSAVAIMDRFTCMRTVDLSHMQLVAAVCLRIAAKLLEVPGMVPSLAKLSLSADNAYPLMAYRKMEMFILSTLKWDLTEVHPLVFMECFSGLVVGEGDEFSGQPVPAPRLVHYEKDVYKYCLFFLELAIQDIQFCSYKPSKVAASAIYCARHVLRIMPVWTPALQFWTGYEASSLQDCVMALLMAYRLAKNAATTPPNVRQAANSEFAAVKAGSSQGGSKLATIEGDRSSRNSSGSGAFRVPQGSASCSSTTTAANTLDSNAASGHGAFSKGAVKPNALKNPPIDSRKRKRESRSDPSDSEAVRRRPVGSE